MNKLFVLVIVLLATDQSFAQKNTIDTTEIEIPVVFHFVTKNGVTKKYDNNQINNILEEVTRRMNTIEDTKLKSPFNSIASKTYLKFVTRTEDKSCEKVDAITYHRTPLNGYNPWIDDIYLRSKGYFKPKEFLNIWVCNLYGKNVTGHTPKRSVLNGIIIDENEFNEIIVKKNQTWTLVHEIGHWLGLKHIWGSPDIHTGNTIDFDIDDCILDDGIDDTPKQKDPHFFDFSFIQDSCDGEGKTNHQNFMDYSYDTGMFTENQVEVMRNNLKTERKGLLWKPNCSNSYKSILSITKLRNKLGTSFNFNQQLSYNTNIDLSLKGLFERELDIFFNEQNLESLGLKIIGTDKFKVIESTEIVNQQAIYQRLDIEYAKGIVNTNPKKFSRIERVKYIRFYDVKNRKYYSQKDFPKQLKQHQIDAFKNENKNNLLLFNYSVGMDYKIYKNDKLIKVQNLSSNKYVNSFNLGAGTYRIICSTKSFYLGNGMKEIEYTKKLADITFDHLINSEQTILIIKGDNKNRIFNKK